jgi:hypothetical protein
MLSGRTFADILSHDSILLTILLVFSHLCHTTVKLPPKNELAQFVDFNMSYVVSFQL